MMRSNYVPFSPSAPVNDLAARAVLVTLEFLLAEPLVPSTTRRVKS